MSIESIGGLSTQVNKLKNQQNVQFRANSTNTLERNPQDDSFEKNGLSTGARVALGTVAVVGALAACDALFNKSKNLKKIFGIADNIKPKPGNPPRTPVTDDVLKETFESFKSKGKFEGGKAVLNDGTLLTGKLVHQVENGEKVILEYKDGLLVNIESKGKLSSINIHDMHISWKDDGTIFVERFENIKDRSVWYRTEIGVDGKAKNYKYEQFNKMRNGKELCLKKETDLSNGKITMFKSRSMSFVDDSYKTHLEVDGKKITKYHYGTGRNVYYDTIFDRATGVFKNQYYKPNTQGKLEPINSYCLTNKSQRDRSVFYELDKDGKIINGRLEATKYDMSRSRNLTSQEVLEFLNGKKLDF